MTNLDSILNNNTHNLRNNILQHFADFPFSIIFNTPTFATKLESIIHMGLCLLFLSS